MNNAKPSAHPVKILAVDTATEACSAALYINGELFECYQLAPREHTQLILQMVEQLLEQQQLTLKQLDALAFGRGPGSFTGVRIATGVVHGLAFASDLPVVPVSTLAAIAQYAYQQSGQAQVLAGIDARMGGIYWGAYALGDDGLMQLQAQSRSRPRTRCSCLKMVNGLAPVPHGAVTRRNCSNTLHKPARFDCSAMTAHCCLMLPPWQSWRQLNLCRDMHWVRHRRSRCTCVMMWQKNLPSNRSQCLLRGDQA